MIKKKQIFLLAIFLCCAGLTSCTNDSKAERIVLLQKDSIVVITISAIGDLMCHSGQYNSARIAADSFDFFPVYREVLNYFNDSDFLIGNLETVTAGRAEGYSGYPFFNTPDEYVNSLKEAGFDLLTTSNNHSLDRGEKGLLRTIDIINQNSLNYVGTYVSKNDRDSIRVFNLKGIKISVLSYSYGTNGIAVPKGKNYLINLIDFNLIENDIRKARDLSEIVLVYFHFGEEYHRLPTDYQLSVVDSTIKYGADIILGGHPHVIQPADFFKTNSARLDKGFVIYSLGNFISNQQWRYSDAGVILNISLTKNFNKDSIYISEVDYIPTWVYKGKTNSGIEYVILPADLYDNADSTYSYLSASDRSKMKEALKDTDEIITKFSSQLSR